MQQIANRCHDYKDKVRVTERKGVEGAHLLFTGSHTSIWRVFAPLLTVLWAKEGTALQGRLLRLSPLKGLAATGAVGQHILVAVRAAIVSEWID